MCQVWVHKSLVDITSRHVSHLQTREKGQNPRLISLDIVIHTSFDIQKVSTTYNPITNGYYKNQTTG